jgi:hypothetical protein
VRGDPEGDGCDALGAYRVERVADADRVVLTVPIAGHERRVALGERGDQVLLGDWDCDGVDTPGLYRPAAGEVQYFDEWPRVEQQAYRADEVAAAGSGGVATLVEGTNGRCDRIAAAGTPRRDG